MSIFNRPFLGGSCTESSSHPFSASRNHNNADDALIEKQFLTREDQQKKLEIDTYFSQAFNTLSFEERKVQQEHLHGVADELAEESSSIENSLKELESCLLKSKAGRVYETAEQQSPSYVHERSLRISFLRAERYNALAAADRMLRFFDEKQKLFGAEKLTKHITIDDLDQDDIVALKTGSMQWAGRDRSNRPILLQVPGLRKFKHLKNELRARYLIMMEGFKSPEAQLRGFIVITYAIGDFKDCHQGHGYLEHNRLSDALPMYLGAFHLVVDDIKQYLLGAAAFAIMPADLRARFRMHLGTHFECLYRLSSYGIPTGLLPFSPATNSINMEPHVRWCQSCITTDSQPSSSVSIVTEPSPNDVVSTGSTRCHNIGNERLRMLVKEHVEAYRSGSNDEKRRIVDQVIGEINRTGGQFLQKEKGSQLWYELPISKVRQKVSQRFRNQHRRRESASQQAREGTLIADNPFPNDVIFGRINQPNMGTALIHHLIKDRLDDYETANRGAKVVVVDAMIERIQSEGGRFLQPSTSDLGGYVEVLSTDSIRDRISTYFRNYRRKA